MDAYRVEERRERFARSWCQVDMDHREDRAVGQAQSTEEVVALRPRGRVDAYAGRTGQGDAAFRRLVSRAVGGDVAAFDRVVQPHVRPLFQLAAAMVGPEEARDVTQETLVSAWRELRRLKRPEKLEPWLRSILMNRARNVLRTRRRHPAVTFEPDAGHGVELTHEPIPALHGHWAVEEALAGLRPEHRAVVVLHYLADLPMRQVAETLGLREGTARSRLHAALTSLRRHFEEAGA